MSRVDEPFVNPSQFTLNSEWCTIIYFAVTQGWMNLKNRSSFILLKAENLDDLHFEKRVKMHIPFQKIN